MIVMLPVRRAVAFPGKTRQWDGSLLWWWAVTLDCGHTRLMPWRRSPFFNVPGKHQPRFAKCITCTENHERYCDAPDLRAANL